MISFAMRASATVVLASILDGLMRMNAPRSRHDTAGAQRLDIAAS